MPNPSTGRYDETILRLATVLVRIVMILLVIGAIGIALAMPGLLLWRTEVLTELARNGISGAPTTALAALEVLLAGAGTMLVLAFLFFRNLLRLMGTVREGDPFVPENADRLRGMAWLLLAMELLGLALGLLSKLTLAHSHGFEFSITGLIAVLSLFVLARVFARGTAMREDIEGTV